MDTLSVRWNGKRQYVSWDEVGHTVVMDARPEYHGDGAGMRPLQVFLAGLAGCTAMDVISILEKKRQDVRDLEVSVEADQREDDFPKIYTAIRLRFTVVGFGVSSEAVRRAIELSEEKYCSVKGMLGPQVTVATSFEIVEASTAGTPSGR
ncbi:MAG: OsmC family protein [Actinomycetota bacterium]|nr:OsmC family protein [Actinomycetota bacterium]MDZ4178961.1 OsmC family protein [Coriobacteriia bacterium]